MKTNTVTITDDYTKLTLENESHLEVTITYIPVRGSSMNAPDWPVVHHFLSYESFEAWLNKEKPMRLDDGEGNVQIACEVRIQAIVYNGDARPLY